ncbi:MAG: helix-turn-helix transcriptional regulator [Deltaproteobacteria bacterium]|nr:helix-turn-helix transcriptional regulator [Deltaproteobacteria bacterium]
MEDQVAAHIASNLRQLREMRGLTQAQLSKLSGVPRPTWANLESGSGNPTVSVLIKVAAALQVTIEELISPPRASCRLYRASEIAVKKRGEVLIRKLLPESIKHMELDRMELPAGARMGGIPHRSGTREYLTCESGEIGLSVSGEQWRLSAGDVIVFRGDQKHSYLNPGARVAVAYSVVMLAPY